MEPVFFSKPIPNGRMSYYHLIIYFLVFSFFFSFLFWVFNVKKYEESLDRRTRKFKFIANTWKCNYCMIFNLKKNQKVSRHIIQYYALLLLHFLFNLILILFYQNLEPRATPSGRKVQIADQEGKTLVKRWA